MRSAATVARPAPAAAAFDDLRDYLHALRRSGDLIEVEDEVDWDLEIGAISRRALEEDLRSVWFHRVKDYPGHSMFAHYCPDYRSSAVALGLPAQTDRRTLRAVYAERSARHIAPVEVPSGPCQTNVVRGDDVDLTALPAPMLHEGDGGRYVGTWDLVVTHDPQTGVTNWGAYRFMLHDRRVLTGNVGRGGGQVLRQRYMPKGASMPVAIVIGVDPLTAIAASEPLAPGVEESGLAGALRGRPVELVKALTSDLRVPAHAQMVIEGSVLPDHIAPEGPYGEFTAYRANDGDRGIALRVDAITFRDEPIHSTDCTGFRAGMAAFGEMSNEHAIIEALRARGIKAIDASVPNDMARNFAFVSVAEGGEAVARETLEVFVERFPAVTAKIFLLDGDVDVADQRAVLHAFAMRLHPGRGIHTLRVEGRVKPLLPYLSHEERLTRSGALVVFDCTWPSDWDRYQIVPARNFFDDVYPEEIRRRAIAQLERARRRMGKH